MDIDEWQAWDLELSKGIKEISEDLNRALRRGIDETGRAALLQRADEKLAQYDSRLGEASAKQREGIDNDYKDYLDRIRSRAKQLRETK